VNVPLGVVVVVASSLPTFEAVSTPTLTVRTGLALLPCAGQPEKFTPDTVTLLPGAAVNGLTENTGTFHEADGFGTVVAAAAPPAVAVTSPTAPAPASTTESTPGSRIRLLDSKTASDAASVSDARTHQHLMQQNTPDQPRWPTAPGTDHPPSPDPSIPADQDQPEHVKTTGPARPDKARPSPFGPAAIRSSPQQIGWRWIQAKVAALTGARCVRRALLEDARVRVACR